MDINSLFPALADREPQLLASVSLARTLYKQIYWSAHMTNICVIRAFPPKVNRKCGKVKGTRMYIPFTDYIPESSLFTHIGAFFLSSRQPCRSRLATRRKISRLKRKFTKLVNFSPEWIPDT